MTEYADRIELQDVMLKYAAGVDENHDELLRSCFADDVIAPGFRREPIFGVDAWITFLREQLSPFVSTQHMLSPVLATISGDSAQARTDLQSMHLYREPEGQMLLVFGTYNTGMIKRDGRWVIQRHELDIKYSRTC
jgi:hypothetical protein